MSEVAEKIRAATAVIKDFPKTGVNFIDITTVLKNPEANQLAITAVQNLFDPESYDVITSPAARGWLLAQPIALALGKPLVVVREPKKLPREHLCCESTSEYDTVTLAVQTGDIPPGSRILIVDDLLATCGTVLATIQLIHTFNAEVVGVAALYDIPYLPKVDLPCPARAVVIYEEPPAAYLPQ